MRRVSVKKDQSNMLRNIINVSAITIIAVISISWIGIMEVNKT